MSHARVNDCNIWYEITGSGTPLLQIGGSGFAHENFAPVSGRMAEHFQVIDFDLRGYGGSDRPEQHYDMEVWADDCAALIDALGFDAVHVHGTSMGGMVAMKLAAKYPQKLRGLILSCTAARCDRMFASNLLVQKALAEAYGMGSEPLALAMSAGALSAAFLDTPDGAATATTIREVLERNCSLSVFRAAVDAIVAMDLSADLDRITAPTLVVCGDVDLLGGLDPGPSGIGNREISQRIPGAELAVMEGVGHANMLESPDESVRIMVDFLERVDRSVDVGV
ncbi:alpha/beta fold hydrolase [Pseudonocardia sp.]|uniref:alpha/beta fold hydrolase n=1 Tax=Pseudonocardia sp. TaxID=60912 RepID=UPI003D0FCB68